jgi:DNA-binding protein H-NS
MESTHGQKKRQKKRRTKKAEKRHNLAGLDFQGLMDLRSQVDEALTGYRSTLERQLEALGSSVALLGGKVARGMRGSKLKGMKVAPKYRGPDGDTWAGRGATPRWLKAAIKEGGKLEDFPLRRQLARRRRRGGKRSELRRDAEPPNTDCRRASINSRASLSNVFPCFIRGLGPPLPTMLKAKVGGRR